MIGGSFGHYRILEQIGAGGMGVVYRATDSRLGRDVALKLLPDVFARDAERMARFEREARLLASLNHANIATVYGLEESGEARAIAMELAEGPSLADRLQNGPVTVQEALSIARQVAEALEAAHEKGIIHRDLKPANVKVSPDGRVKVLDFGLAKALAGDAGDVAASPTISEVATRDGVILGTAAYMSPEQARGKPLDRRTDIWSFGCLLYEMLTGRMAFKGDTISDTLVRILGGEPDWEALPADTPANVRTVLSRCLRKEARDRLRDIGDARIELSEQAVGGPATAQLIASARPIWRHPLPVSLAAIVVLLAALLTWSLVRAPRTEGAPAGISRLSINLPAGRQLLADPGALAISPDGRDLVFAADEDRGRPGLLDDAVQLYRRSLADPAATPIPGTEMGSSPFFSPDGEWLGFVSPDGLKKVSLLGGTPISVSGSAGAVRCATWMRNDLITYATDWDLFRLPSDGGHAELVLARAQLQKGELFIDYPSALPGAPALLISLINTDPSRTAIAVLSDGVLQRILSGGIRPTLLPTGHLFYLRLTQPGGNRYDGYAVSFDRSRFRVTGKEKPVLEDVRHGQFAISRNGTLAYNSSGVGESMQQLAWVSRDGASEAIADRQAVNAGQGYRSPRFSPDGGRLIYAFGKGSADSRLYVRDLATGATHIIGGASSWWAEWTPDGRRVAYIRMNPEGTAGNIFLQSAGGSGPEERLTRGDRHQQPQFVTPDGDTLVFQEQSPDTGYDLWALSLRGDHTPRPLLQTRANERLASLSPERPFHMAYVSDQSGRDEIWVRPFPDGEGAQQVSTDGGTAPRWSRDGLTLFYRDVAATRLLAVPVTWSAGPVFGSATVISGWWRNDLTWGRQYDVHPDGKRLVMIAASSTAGSEITVVLNWFEELKRKMQGK